MSTPHDQPALFEVPGGDGNKPTRPVTRPSPDATPQQQQSRESNDYDLLHSVAAVAGDCGYLLVGAAERVYRRTDHSGEVVRVPRYEEDAVHQLLRHRGLTLGAQHTLTCGAATLTGTSVLVPKATRARVIRWRLSQSTRPLLAGSSRFHKKGGR